MPSSHTRANPLAPDASLQLQLQTAGTWWVLAMDGGRARLLTRTGLHDAFEESPSLLLDAAGAPIEPVVSGHHHGRYEKTERQFTERIAERLEALAVRGAYEHLAVFAAPAVLGVLRGAYGSHTLSRLRHEEAADITGQPIDEIRRRLASR